MSKKYATSPLAQLRVRAGITQKDAGARLGYKWKQPLSHIETGRVMAPKDVLVKMATLYDVPQRVVLSAAIATWETGVMSMRHKARKIRLQKTG